MRDDAVLGRALPLDRGLGPSLAVKRTVKTLHKLPSKIISMLITSESLRTLYTLPKKAQIGQYRQFGACAPDST